MPDPSVNRLFQLMSALLEYPDAHLARRAGDAAALASACCPEGAAALLSFQSAALNMPPGVLEEEYTQTFELNPEQSLYVGYHLFGESYKRSLFLLGLKERYQAQGFETGRELPDHLAVMLRYLAGGSDPATESEIVREAILPALDKMLAQTAADLNGDVAGQEGNNLNLYSQLLGAVRQILGSQVLERSSPPLPNYPA